MNELLVAIAIAIVAFALYMFPTILAYRRGKRNRASIMIMNLFFGWTFAIWFLCLIWAMNYDA